MNAPECTCGQASGYEGYDACRQGCDDDCPVCSNDFMEESAEDIALNLESLADGEEDHMGQLLTAAAAKLRAQAELLTSATERLERIERIMSERPTFWSLQLRLSADEERLDAIEATLRGENPEPPHSCAWCGEASDPELGQVRWREDTADWQHQLEDGTWCETERL